MSPKINHHNQKSREKDQIGKNSLRPSSKGGVEKVGVGLRKSRN